MKPIFWVAVTAVAGGITYGLVHSSARIGGRFAEREKILDREKWLKEGVEIDNYWLS
jgi:hypothetical protein